MAHRKSSGRKGSPERREQRPHEQREQTRAGEKTVLNREPARKERQDERRIDEGEGRRPPEPTPRH
jgi:hypothetical protein